MRHGSHLDPPNRFENTHAVPDLEHLEWDEEYLHQREHRPIELIEDSSQTIVSENNSPDIPFRYSVNPYRGCIHGCSYCYARNSHEYLGLNAGLDFETKIVVKRDASTLLRKFLSRRSWQSEPIAFSGVTDCYQPIERELGLTRQCLEVADEFSQPVTLITKNALVVRDKQLLASLAARNLVHVAISITTLKPQLAREMEPRTSIPSARLRAIELLAKEGIPVRVMVAPMIPGLNDHEMPQIMKSAREAGAQAAGYVLLRLPLTVEPVFLEWLRRTQPLKAEKVESLIRDTRQGGLNNSSWGQRMTGAGQIAEQIKTMFQVFQQKYGFKNFAPLDCSQFSRPAPQSSQLRLFQ